MRKWVIAVIIATVFLGAVLVTGSKWDGDITEAAADPMAAEAGVEEVQILPWSIEGDLLLFIFLTGGAAAGFVAGYNWRKLFSGSSASGKSNSTGSGQVERGIT